MFRTVVQALKATMLNSGSSRESWEMESRNGAFLIFIGQRFEEEKNEMNRNLKQKEKFNSTKQNSFLL